MTESIVDIASDPRQYDRDELIWTAEGAKDNWNRKLYLEALQPILASIKNQAVLDVGCGQGWLCDEIARQGGQPLGIDSSAKNIAAARAAHPHLPFIEVALQDFATEDRFNLVLAVMVFEHFADAGRAFAKLGSLLKPDGRIVAIVGDFEKLTTGRSGYRMEVQPITDGEVATRVDYGKRLGILCDIVRTLDRYKQAADQSGLSLKQHIPLLPSKEHPRYITHKGRALFHLLEYARQT